MWRGELLDPMGQSRAEREGGGGARVSCAGQGVRWAVFLLEWLSCVPVHEYPGGSSTVGVTWRGLTVWAAAWGRGAVLLVESGWNYVYYL